jgi:hypothetical protein
VNVRGVPISALMEAGMLYLGRRVRRPPGYPGTLLEASTGRGSLSADERRLALGCDAALRRLGVRCLRRAAVVSEMLRRRGIAARIRLSVSAADPRHAHAEVEVGEVALRPEVPGRVVLR